MDARFAPPGLYMPQILSSEIGLTWHFWHHRHATSPWCPLASSLIDATMSSRSQQQSPRHQKRGPRTADRTASQRDFPCSKIIHDWRSPIYTLPRQSHSAYASGQPQDITYCVLRPTIATFSRCSVHASYHSLTGSMRPPRRRCALRPSIFQHTAEVPSPRQGRGRTGVARTRRPRRGGGAEMAVAGSAAARWKLVVRNALRSATMQKCRAQGANRAK